MTARAGVDSRPVIRRLELSLPAPPGTFGMSGCRHNRHAVWVPHPRATSRQMAEAAGVTLRTIERWKAGGRIPFHRADEIAVRLGCHPVDLWPEWFDLYVEAVA